MKDKQRELNEWYVIRVSAGEEVILQCKDLMTPSQAAEFKQKATNGISLTISRRVETLEPL